LSRNKMKGKRKKNRWKRWGKRGAGWKDCAFPRRAGPQGRGDNT